MPANRIRTRGAGNARRSHCCAVWRLAPRPFGEDLQAQLPPALEGVDHRAVGLEFDVAAGGGEVGCGHGVGVQPVGHQPRFLIADLADGLVAGAQAAEFGEELRGAIKGPTGPGQGQQLAGLRADEAGQA
jgi:hypothetical protein